MEMQIYPSPNYYVGREGHSIVAIVDHIAQGYNLGEYFSNPNVRKSSNFSISELGVITQHVAIGDTAWANGIDFTKGYIKYKSDLTIKWIADCWQYNINPNLVTVSVEHEGLSGVPLSEEQYQATLYLHTYLLGELNLEPSEVSIVGHFKLDAINRINCPGSGFPWERLRKDLNTMDVLAVQKLHSVMETAWNRQSDAHDLIIALAGDNSEGAKAIIESSRNWMIAFNMVKDNLGLSHI